MQRSILALTLVSLTTAGAHAAEPWLVEKACLRLEDETRATFAAQVTKLIGAAGVGPLMDKRAEDIEMSHSRREWSRAGDDAPAVAVAQPLDYGGCIGTIGDNGAWAVRYELDTRLTSDRQGHKDACIVVRARARFAYVGADGKLGPDALRSESNEWAVATVGRTENPYCTESPIRHLEPTDVQVLDLEGDGRGELAIRWGRESSFDGDPWRFYRIPPIGGRGAGPIAVPFEVLSWTDHDGDGRVDLLGPSFWDAAHPSRKGSLARFAHALPDGRYVEDDAVVRAWLARECAAAPPPPWSFAGADDAKEKTLARARRWIECVLAYGADPYVLAAGLRPVIGTSKPDTFERDVDYRLASWQLLDDIVAPPVAFAAPEPKTAPFFDAYRAMIPRALVRAQEERVGALAALTSPTTKERCRAAVALLESPSVTDADIQQLTPVFRAGLVAEDIHDAVECAMEFNRRYLRTERIAPLLFELIGSPSTRSASRKAAELLVALPLRRHDVRALTDIIERVGRVPTLGTEAAEEIREAAQSVSSEVATSFERALLGSENLTTRIIATQHALVGPARAEASLALAQLANDPTTSGERRVDCLRLADAAGLEGRAFLPVARAAMRAPDLTVRTLALGILLASPEDRGRALAELEAFMVAARADGHRYADNFRVAASRYGDVVRLLVTPGVPVSARAAWRRKANSREYLREVAEWLEDELDHHRRLLEPGNAIVIGKRVDVVMARDLAARQLHDLLAWFSSTDPHERAMRASTVAFIASMHLPVADYADVLNPAEKAGLARANE